MKPSSTIHPRDSSTAKRNTVKEIPSGFLAINCSSQFHIFLSALFSLLLSLPVLAEGQLLNRTEIAYSRTGSRVSDSGGDYIDIRFRNTTTSKLTFYAAALNGVNKSARRTQSGGDLNPNASFVMTFYLPKGQDPDLRITFTPGQSTSPPPKNSPPSNAPSPPPSTAPSKPNSAGSSSSPLSSSDVGKLAGTWVGTGPADRFRSGSRMTVTLSKNGTGTWSLETNFRNGGSDSGKWDLAVSSGGNNNWVFYLTNGTSKPRTFTYNFKLADGILQTTGMSDNLLFFKH